MFNFKLVTFEINSRLCNWHSLISQGWSLTPTADKVKKKWLSSDKFGTTKPLHKKSMIAFERENSAWR